jgi:hypothetical protein
MFFFLVVCVLAFCGRRLTGGWEYANLFYTALWHGATVIVSVSYLLFTCCFWGLSLAWTENICYSLYDNHEHFACKLAHLLIEIVLFLIAVSSPLLPTKLSILRYNI